MEARIKIQFNSGLKNNCRTQKINLFILPIIFLFSISVFSQTSRIRFQHLGQEDGLSQSTQFCIYQDNKGFIWVGTEDGLNRFDGYKFTSFHNERNNPNSLSANYVYSITEDNTGTLWIGTDNGLNKFDSEKETFKRYMHNPDDAQSLRGNRIFVLFKDKYNILWIGSDKGLHKFNFETDNFDYYSNDPDDPNSLSDDWITSITGSANEILWIGTNSGGVNSFHYNNKTFTRYLNNPANPNSLSSNTVLAIHEDKGGTLWIGTQDGGLNLFDYNKKIFYRLNDSRNKLGSLHADWINSLYEDDNRNIWIGTNYNGLFVYNYSEKTFTNFKKNPGDKYAISGNRVLCFFEDKSHVLWIGMYGTDINKMAESSADFEHYYVQPDNPNSLNKNMVRSFYIDHSNNLWVGTDGGGINIFNPERTKNTIFENVIGDKSSISNNRIFSIIKDGGGKIWIGTFGGGLNLFNEKNKTFKRFISNPNDSESLSNNQIRTIFTAKNNYLWIGTDGGGLNRLDLTTWKFKRFLNKPSDIKCVSNNRIFSIIKDNSSENLWLGTFGGGLDKFNPATESFIHYRFIPEVENCLPNDYVITLYQDADNYLWIGTNGGGLTKFNPSTELFETFTTRDGLIHNSVYGILPDNSGNLWISTTGGISKFNIKTENFENYNVNDGLQANEFNGGAKFKSDEGVLYFGGINGFNEFNPEEIVENENIPEIVISDFQLFNKSVKVSSDESTPLNKTITETKVITLSHSQNVFSFEYAALDFTAPEKNEYAYIMEGLDEVWNYVGNRRFVTYTGLQPGHYTFRVTGSNNDGIWNPEGTSLEIIITPPFWQTFWFKSVGIVIMLLIIWGIYKYRVKNIQARNENLETQVKARTRELSEVNATKDKFFSIISHDLRSPFQGLLTLSDFLANNIDDYDKDDIKDMAVDLNKSSNVLFDLLNNLLDWSRLQTQNMNAEQEEINLRDMVERIIGLLSINACDKHILLTSDIDEEITVLADTNMLNSVIQNLVTNAIKFTDEGGGIKVSAQELDDIVQVSVADTGVGMDMDTLNKIFRIDTKVTTPGTKNEKGTGLGLILCKELIEKNGGKIHVESKPGDGTTFRFSIKRVLVPNNYSLQV